MTLVETAVETAVAARMRTSAGSAVTRASARRDAGGGPFLCVAQIPQIFFFVWGDGKRYDG